MSDERLAREMIETMFRIMSLGISTSVAITDIISNAVKATERNELKHQINKNIEDGKMECLVCANSTEAHAIADSLKKQGLFGMAGQVGGQWVVLTYKREHELAQNCINGYAIEKFKNHELENLSNDQLITYMEGNEKQLVLPKEEAEFVYKLTKKDMPFKITDAPGINDSGDKLRFIFAEKDIGKMNEALAVTSCIMTGPAKDIIKLQMIKESTIKNTAYNKILNKENCEIDCDGKHIVIKNGRILGDKISIDKLRNAKSVTVKANNETITTKTELSKEQMLLLKKAEAELALTMKKLMQEHPDEIKADLSDYNVDQSFVEFMDIQTDNKDAVEEKQEITEEMEQEAVKDAYEKFESYEIDDPAISLSSEVNIDRVLNTEELDEVIDVTGDELDSATSTTSFKETMSMKEESL